MPKYFSFGDYECKECGHLIDEDDDVVLLNEKGEFIGFVCNACDTKEMIKNDVPCEHEVTTAEKPKIKSFSWEEVNIDFEEVCEKCQKTTNYHNATFRRNL